MEPSTPPQVVLPKPASVGAADPATGDLKLPSGRVAAPKEVAYVRRGLELDLSHCAHQNIQNNVG